MIFAYIYYDGTYIVEHVSEPPRPCPSWPGLSLTCRQLNNETALLPYKSNEFEFPSMWSAEGWLEVLDKTVLVREGEENIPLNVVVHLEIGSKDDEPYAPIQIEAVIKRLEGEKINIAHVRIVLDRDDEYCPCVCSSCAALG
jgi:hypothetical protein